MGETMNYPDSAMEFIKSYSFKDEKEIYTNGSGLIPVFRVEQMIEHYIPARWIPVSERLPRPSEFLGFTESGGYMKRLEVAYMTDTIEYTFGYFDGCKWIKKRYDKINDVVAWKVHEPFGPQT